MARRLRHFPARISPNSSLSGCDRISPSLTMSLRRLRTVFATIPVSRAMRASSASDSCSPSPSRMSRISSRAAASFILLLHPEQIVDLLTDAPSSTASVIGSLRPGTSTASMRNACATPFAERLPATTWITRTSGDSSSAAIITTARGVCVISTRFCASG